MRSKRFNWTVRVAVVALLVGLEMTLGYRSWFSPRKLGPAPASIAQPQIRPRLVIDTNAVLGDVLAGISDMVERLKLPLATPLTSDKVLRFETRPVLLGRPSSLRSELKNFVAGGEALAMPDPVAWRGEGLPEQPSE